MSNNELENPRKAYYRTATDVAYYFRDKDSVQEFLRFIFQEAMEQIKDAKKIGMNIYSPISFNNESDSYITDYQFLVHCVAKFISKKLKLGTIYKRVLSHFAIKSVKQDTVVLQNNRKLLMMLFRNSSLISSSKAYQKKINYNNYFTPVIISYNDEIFDMKVVSLNKYMIHKFYGNDFENFEEENRDFIYDDDILQEAFGYMEVKNFNFGDTKRKLYFSFFADKVEEYVTLKKM